MQMRNVCIKGVQYQHSRAGVKSKTVHDYKTYMSVNWSSMCRTQSADLSITNWAINRSSQNFDS